MKRSCLVFALLLLPCVVRSFAQERNHHVKTYDAGGIAIEAGFVPDESQIILGQPLFITFTVINRTDKPFTFFVGGDNRGSVRPNSFHITAVDAQGQAVTDPYSYRHFGGHWRSIALKTAQCYTERLYLGYWCAFEKPGVYAVTCKRILENHGRGPTRSAVPIVTHFKLRIAPFDPGSMRKIIEGLGNKLLHEHKQPAFEPKPDVDFKLQREQFKNLLKERKQKTYEAALSLAAIPDEQVIPYLAVVAQDTRHNEPAMLAAISGLAQFSSNEAADILIEGLRHTGNSVRDPSAHALRKMKRLDRAVMLFLKELAADSPMTRAVACRALGSTKDQRALAPLIKSLNDEDVTVRRAAASALGPLGYKKAIRPLRKHTKADDMTIRVATARSLQLLGEPLQPEWLTPVLRTSTDINNQNFHEAIRLIRLYGGERAAPALISCLNFDDPSPKNSHNMFLILAIHHSPGGPQYYYKFHSDPNTDGTPEQIEENRKILAELRKWLQEKH